MTDTFTPPVAPSTGTTSAVEMKTAETAFGDGYTQRAGDGLNPEQRRTTVEWKTLDIAGADEIEAFLAAHQGFRAFFWQGPRDGAMRRYRCRKWSRDNVAALIDSISAEFELVHDL